MRKLPFLDWTTVVTVVWHSKTRCKKLDCLAHVKHKGNPEGIGIPPTVHVMCSLSCYHWFMSSSRQQLVHAGANRQVATDAQLGS